MERERQQGIEKRSKRMRIKNDGCEYLYYSALI